MANYIYPQGGYPFGAPGAYMPPGPYVPPGPYMPSEPFAPQAPHMPPGPYVPPPPYVPSGPYGPPGSSYTAPYGFAAPYGAPWPNPMSGTAGAAPCSSLPPPPPYTASVPEKNCFYIRTRLNGLVLDVEMANQAPGTPVITWHQKSGHCKNQIWYDDISTGTIRSKLNDYCLSADGNRVILRPYQPGDPNQLWEFFSNSIRNRHQLNRVLRVDGSHQGAGAKVLVDNQCQKKGQNYQLFDLEFISSPAATSSQLPLRRCFHIVSEMNCKVLDIQGGSPSSGTQVIMWPKKHGRNLNQLWYFDNTGVIHSALNDMAFDSGNTGNVVRMRPYTGEARQQWRFVGNKITNGVHECLDICRESNKDGAELISYKYKGSANQHWRMEYE